MAKKIIVAGAGHGGIAAAAILARADFEVTVYEKHARADMGYDWPDTFELESLNAAQLPLPDETKFTKSTNITFVPPSENTIITQDLPPEALTVKMERKELYKLLISTAEEAGVKFKFKSEITAPLLAGDRVIGIKAAKKEHFADLVIDACGCNSVIRKGLPDCLGIQKEPAMNEKFYVYRGLYEKKQEAFHKYKVYLIPNGRMGIGWVIGCRNYTDILLGEFESYTLEEAQERIEFFKANNPALGDKLLRGGQLAEIPVRQTLAIIVADGYAAIGDSAFMTMPLIGSGISNSFKAAGILADVIINDKTETYSAETLWDYQKRYFNEVGFTMAKTALVRCLLPKLTAEEVDNAFDNQLLTIDDLAISTNGIQIDTSLIKKAIAVIKDRNLSSMLAELVTDFGKLSSISSKLPEHYCRKEVIEWAEKYNSIFN